MTGSLIFALDCNTLREANEQERLQFGAGAFDRPDWLAISTHLGEEEPVIEAFEQLKAEQPNALLMLAPRHPDRMPGILAMPAMRRYQVVRHSTFQCGAGATSEAGAASGTSLTFEDDVLVIDTLGQLGALTGCADAVFVGGSLIPHGGHNPLEAVASCLPIISGPHTYNFAGIYRDLLEADADKVTAMGERAGAYQSVQKRGGRAAMGRPIDPPAVIIRHLKRSARLAASAPRAAGQAERPRARSS